MERLRVIFHPSGYYYVYVTFIFLSGKKKPCETFPLPFLERLSLRNTGCLLKRMLHNEPGSSQLIFTSPGWDLSLWPLLLDGLTYFYPASAALTPDPMHPDVVGLTSPVGHPEPHGSNLPALKLHVSASRRGSKTSQRKLLVIDRCVFNPSQNKHSHTQLLRVDSFAENKLENDSKAFEMFTTFGPAILILGCFKILSIRRCACKDIPLYIFHTSKT